VFGETVRGHRRRLGLTQAELAGVAGMSVRNLRDLEAGRIAEPRPSTVRLLADAFGLAGADRDRFRAAARAAVPEPAADRPRQRRRLDAPAT
jgi:transcriptional regulator with XRE-family HTH domain